MTLSHALAGRSREVAATRAFLSPVVNSATFEESSAHPHASWKWPLHLRIWSGEGPKGNATRSVLTVLLWNSDGTGRTWLGIPSIMEKTGLGNERTVRRALDVLAKDGWLHVAPQTWETLTAEQLAMGRKAPRRGDVGQAPHLYTVLSSPRQATSDLPNRPHHVPPAEIPVEQTPRQICLGGPGQICLGGPGADLPPDPNPYGSESRMVSEQGAARAPSSTHDFSKASMGTGDGDGLEAWNLLVKVHAEKTTKVYGVSPLRPDLKRDERKAVAECLEGVALELTAQLRARGMARELVQVRQDLAARVISLYFKRDNEHLRSVKHALRDLPREFHARITEAKQLILRESHDAANVPRRTPTLELPTRGAQIEKAAQMTKSESLEKPLPVDVTRAHAGQLLEMLAATSPKDEAPKAPSKAEERASSLGMERSPETAHQPVSPPVQRSTGRVGAPRWGAMVPTPTKVRTVSRLQIPEPEPTTESVEPHPRK